MNTRKHTIRSSFLIFLCMMLMMCITACGEKETKEYPDIGIELSLNENYVTNIKEQSKKEFQNSVYSLKEIGRYTGNNIEGYLYQF